jgi:hypothetical protein
MKTKAGMLVQREKTTVANPAQIAKKNTACFPARRAIPKLINPAAAIPPMGQAESGVHHPKDVATLAEIVVDIGRQHGIGELTNGQGHRRQHCHQAHSGVGANNCDPGPKIAEKPPEPLGAAKRGDALHENHGQKKQDRHRRRQCEAG